MLKMVLQEISYLSNKIDSEFYIVIFPWVETLTFGQNEFNWENYMNTLLLTNESGLNRIPTKIYSIIDIKKWEKDKKI